MQQDGSDQNPNQVREYTFSATLGHRQDSFLIEDARWIRGKQIRDWVIVLAVLVLNVVMILIDYFLEPGMS